MRETSEINVAYGPLPSMTIITPCRNGEAYVTQALESVARQHYPQLEHIVLDACSTDNTLALVRNYPSVKMISEPDDSAHDAMNKGLSLTRGEVIGFLNVDDLYPDDILGEVGLIFAERPEVDIVVGNAVWFEGGESGERRILFERAHEGRGVLSVPGVAFGFLPGFNGCFFRRRVFNDLGKFETKYNFAADSHFLLRCALADVEVALIDKPTIWYRQHAGSRTFNPERRFLIRIYWELFEMALELSDEAVSYEERRCLLAWHAFTGSKLVARSFARGQVSKALRAIMQLISHNPLWPAYLFPAISLRNESQKLYRRPASGA